MDKRRSLLVLLLGLALAGCSGQSTASTPTPVPSGATAAVPAASSDATSTTASAAATSTTSAAAATTSPTQTAASSAGSATATEGSASSSGNPVEIKFVGMAGGVAGFQARADEFMKTHPNIKVKVEGVPANSWGEFLQGIEVNIAAGDIPDVADIASEGQQTFAKSGLIAPIDDYLKRDQAELKPTLDDINPRLLDALKIDGKTYGLPTVWNNMVIYYNKKVLQEAGLQPPKSVWTIDDFINMSEKVVANNNGGQNDKWGYVFANQYFLTLVPWMLANGGNVLTDDWTASRLQDPNSIAAVQMLHDFVYKYKISPPIDAGIADTDLFEQNKLAFMGAGLWDVNTLKLAKFNPDDYDVVPFPQGKTNHEVVGIGAAPIFTASQHKDEAW